MYKRQRTNKQNNNTPLILSSLLIVVGLIVVIIFSVKISKQNQMTKDYATTQGTIIDYEISHSRKTGSSNKSYSSHRYRPIFYPIVEYTVDGTTYEITSEYGFNSKYEDNRISVKYDPADPQKAILVQPKAPLPFIVVGLFFILGGIAVLCMNMHNEKVQMTGGLLFSIDILALLIFMLSEIKEDNISWNPIAIIKHNPVAILIYFLILVAIYVIVYLLFSIFLLSKPKTAAIAECIEIRDYTETKERVFFREITKKQKKQFFFCITILKENNIFTTNQQYLVDFSKALDNGSIKQTEPYGDVKYFYYLNERCFENYKEDVIDTTHS